MAHLSRIFRVVPLALLATAVLAQAPVLSPAGKRMTDSEIHADHQTYQEQDARLRELNATGQHPLSGYAMAKAQCWLDVSLHEYTRNDRSSFPQEALEQSYLISERLAGRAATGGPDPIAGTPRVNGAELLRPDLWQMATDLKKHAGYACVQQRVACAEVQLVHAGNEFNQSQWRGALPYVQMAEDALAEAARVAPSCPAR